MDRAIKLVYFAWVRERLGLDNEEIPLGRDVKTVGDVLMLLSDRGGCYADLASDAEKLRFALDQDYATLASTIGSAEELAIFPPVTGG